VEQKRYQLDDELPLRGVLNHPVVYVTWHDARAYCQWLTEQLQEWPGTPEPLATLLRREGWQVTLPSEAEWEKAARGTQGGIYRWGDKFDQNKANTDETGIDGTSAVGCFPQGATPEGVVDLSGNVWEWTRSLWENEQDEAFAYPYQPDDGREQFAAPDNVRRVLRGGAYFNDQRQARCACPPQGRPVRPLRRHRISGGGASITLNSETLNSETLDSETPPSAEAPGYTTTPAQAGFQPY
jgi:formylglycine-generating enzyme required for sulfatase activity